MKKLLILGAGIYQVPLIKKAKEMGLYTIAASCPGPYPGLAVADKRYEIDTTDANRLLAAAKAEGIDGVCTTGTDVAVESLGMLCEQLKLPGISRNAARILTNKADMKEAFIQNGVATPRAQRVFCRKEALRVFAALGSPVMVKAVDLSGSRGIIKVNNKAELEQAYDTARQMTHKDYLLIEEFCSGHEIGVDGFVSNGELKLLLPHNKFVLTTKGVSLPLGHHFPYHCSESLEADIRRQIELAISASGANHCAVNADVIVKNNQAVILEMGGRAGATCIPELITAFSGVDYYEQIIRSALGVPVDLSPTQKVPCMAKLLFANRTGTLTEIDDDFLAGLCAQGIDASIDFSPGTVVSAVKNGTDRIGQLMMKTDSAAELDAVMAKLQSHIKIDGIPLDTWNE